MAWNFDISQAPKGTTKQVERLVGKEKTPTPTMFTVHVPDLIIAAGNDRVVTLSKWLPDDGRWSMFTKAVPPLAWQPWPDHPEAAE